MSLTDLFFCQSERSKYIYEGSDRIIFVTIRLLLVTKFSNKTALKLDNSKHHTHQEASGSRNILEEKATVNQIFKNFLAFYGNQDSISLRIHLKIYKRIFQF